jgi:hypothetical protein
MKHNPSPYTRSFRPIVLWRDDLERIIAILVARGEDVEIIAEEYSFETVAELVHHFGTIHPLTVLEIKGQKPYATLDLGRLDARLFVSSRENGSGVFFELSKVLAAGQRRWPIIYSWPFILTLGWGNNVWPLLGKYITGWEFRYAVLDWLVISFSWMIWAMFIRLRRTSVVHLARRSEAQSFSQRNKDQLIVAIISAIVGALLGVAGAKLADRIWLTPDANGAPILTPSDPSK